MPYNNQLLVEKTKFHTSLCMVEINIGIGTLKVNPYIFFSFFIRNKKDQGIIVPNWYLYETHYLFLIKKNF